MMLHRLVLALILGAIPALAHSAGTSSEIAQETSRTLREGSKRLASFWWLPAEYWHSAARELSLTPDEQAQVQRAFRDYVLVGVVDARLGESAAQPELATIADLVKRLRVYRNGEEVSVLREINPELAALVPRLVYVLRASLGPLGDGLRLLPFANVDAKGKPILTGMTPGELSLEFRFELASHAHSLHWHAPLTAIAGPRPCPKAGEPLEASFQFCPWHGVKAEPGSLGAADPH